MADKRITIQSRYFHEVNTDPQRRCYNGCYYKSEWVWSDWEKHSASIGEEKDVPYKLKFWRELNDYAVSERGKSARKEFRAVDEDGLIIIKTGDNK